MIAFKCLTAFKKKKENWTLTWQQRHFGHNRSATLKVSHLATAKCSIKLKTGKHCMQPGNKFCLLHIWDFTWHLTNQQKRRHVLEDMLSYFSMPEKESSSRNFMSVFFFFLVWFLFRLNLESFKTFIVWLGSEKEKAKRVAKMSMRLDIKKYTGSTK